MLLSEKYRKEYENKNKGFSHILDRIKEVEKKSNIEVLNWKTEQIEDFLISFKSVSPMALSRNLSILRNYVEYIVEKEGLPKHKYQLSDEVSLYDLIDFDKLMRETIDYQQYRYIREQLITINNENIRDRLIFELAWVGLTNEEIQKLKEKDVEFMYSDEFGWEVAFLNVSNKKVFKVEDFEIVEDIKACINEQYYIVNSKDGKTKKMSYRDSEYLIKPVNVGKNKKEDYLKNPSLTLQKVFITQDIQCPGIDMTNLTVESIRRSKIIYLLAPFNKKYFDIEFIQLMFDFSSSSALYWLEKAAKMKYGDS